jgi:type IV pilus assembly protein PilM
MMPFGLDIGNSSIKAVHLEQKGDKFSLLAAGITAAPSPGVASENEKDLIAVADAIKKLINDTKITSKQANVSLPDNQVFTRLITLPLLTDQEIASAISWQAEPYIPIPVSQASVAYQIVERREPAGGKQGGVDVLLVATPKSLIEKYIKLANFAGITIVSVESDLLALTRSVAPQDQTAVLIDVGSSATNISISKAGQLIVSRSIATGGNALTRAVATGLLVSSNQAEEYKKTYGLNPKALEGRVKQAIEPAFKIIIDEIKKTVQYYKTDVGKDDQVTLAIASGGTAGLAEIVPYLAEQLGMEVILGDPFSRIIKDDKLTRQLEPWSPLYGIAVGLAENI